MKGTQEQPRQAGRLVMRQDPWKANSGAKLRLGRPVPVSRSCLHQDELHLAKSPIADAASRDAAGGEDDLEPLAPAEEYVLGSPATSSSRQPGNSWEPTFKAKAPEGYRRWQPRAAGTASPARGGPLGPPLPGTLVYASAQDLPPAAAPPEDDEHSDAEAPSEANPPSSAEASGNEAPLEESSGDEEPEAPEESVSAVPASVAIKTDVQAVDEQDLTFEQMKIAVTPLVCRALPQPVSLQLPLGIYNPLILPITLLQIHDNPLVNMFDVIGNHSRDIDFAQLEKAFVDANSISNFSQLPEPFGFKGELPKGTKMQIFIYPRRDGGHHIIKHFVCTLKCKPKIFNSGVYGQAYVYNWRSTDAKVGKKIIQYTLENLGGRQYKIFDLVSYNHHFDACLSTTTSYIASLLSPAEKSEKDRSYTSEDVSAEMRPKKTSKEEAPDSDRAAADSAEPMAEKKSKKATSNKAKSASFLSDDESGSEAQTLAAPFAGGVTEARIAVLTASDRATSGVYEDKSGPAVVEAVNLFAERSGVLLPSFVEQKIVPDDEETIFQRAEFPRLVSI
ncbi:hypothetical protein AK812_SmicGene901 [Symbiodinium microadriaticum]|uniref:Uncharacterized protein n=1 Tax=Symbiodinium microadriaticum TaxID=2951 RepID=A0A1Q9F5F8_SYMMI|nr:hypothetical protein AK812_SmicGene901 [Symbiodinium microadriaticum]